MDALDDSFPFLRVRYSMHEGYDQKYCVIDQYDPYKSTKLRPSRTAF